MRPLILLLVVSVLSACATAPKQPPPVVVEVPVSVPCIDQVPTAPDFETQYLQADDSLCVITDALLVERQQRMIYVEQLKASIAGCITEGK